MRITIARMQRDGQRAAGGCANTPAHRRRPSPNRSAAVGAWRSGCSVLDAKGATMKRSRILQFVAVGAVAGWVAAAGAQEPSGNSAPQEQGAASQPTGAMSAQLITAAATVDKVDRDKHELTLKSENGKPFTIDVPDSVNRLDNVKPGDKVRVSFYESVAVSLAKPGEAQPRRQETMAAGRAPGALPGGAVAQQITTTAKITKVTPSKDELTIEGPGGKATTIKVDDPQVRSQLSHLKVGDKIQTTYTQAMATRVTPARAM
jgi:Cu/Ag efflux protein CusF